MYSFINQSASELSISSDSVYGDQTAQYILLPYANDVSTNLNPSEVMKMTTNSVLFIFI